ncbi:S8 family serine peptidase [Pseudomonadales bacterium]|nr:S8 family serine peptidase [Pseudomonadales bacterium]
MKPKLQTRLNNLFNQIFKPSIKRDHLAASRHLNRTLIDSPQGTKSLLKIIFQGPTAVLCIAFLSACGGGGGGGGPAVPVNRSPVFNLATSLSVAEGTTSITTISVSDPDRDPVTLSFFGPDASQLSLTANQLSFKIPPSFAAPTDADRDGTYEISISAADGLGGATTVATQITVYNRLDGRIVDGPVAGSQVFLDANANRRRDANEPTFTSDASGYFSVTDVGSVCPATGLCDALVVALGGSDTATGQELPGLALFGESLGDEDFIISPVSTLLTLSSTPAAVLTALDLNINPAAITRTDPWETATADNLAGQKLLRINQQLGLFMTSTLALNLNATAAANTIAVANAFDTLIATDALIDLTVSDTLNTLLASALGASDASTNAVAQTMADFNTVINSSTIDPRGAQASAILTTIQANFLEGIKQLSQGTQSAAQFNAQFSAQTLVTAIGADVGLPDQDSDGTPDLVDDDDDGDGVPDSTDAFPLDSTETIDTDADGTGNNADTDDDGDGALDVNDAFPLDATESLDTDNDGQGNNTDEDDDGDGVPDSTDAFPLDSTETIDTDGDGTGNNTDTDDDGDGVDDTRDTNPLDSSLTPPTAVLTLDISEGFSPLLVSVNASSSIAGFGDDTITSYTWNFGDGDSSTEEATSHIYTQVGSFEISLTLTNSDGFSHTATQTVTTSLVTDPLIIEGTIFVSSSVTVDSDVNDSGSTPVSNNTRATAQFVTNPVTIGGFANEAGTGPNFDGLSNLTASGDEFDAYRINALGGEVINLRIATRGDGDLDLLLYDLDGQLIDFSVSATDNESITIPAGAATYDVVVESFAGYSNYVLSVGLDPAIASLSTATGSASVFIGDLIVQPKNDHQAPRMLAQANRVIGEQASARANSRLYQFGNNITEMLAPRIRTRMLPRMATGKPTMTELKLATILAAKQLNRQNDVEYAEPNYRLTAQIEPNDEFYERQWHYQKLNLPAAWNQSTGANNVKIAVLDTGVVANHPDLEARLSADSYDFISNASNAGDGDGVDSDARDPGDGQDNSACSTASSRSSSFHGTHVAGTIGASTNNNIGTAGVTWAGEIMNLRVLGCEGGSTFDIAQALLYAAGVDNAYGLSPTKTADVANLSLGGGPPNNVMDDAVQAARAAGMIIIAAAGNSGDATLSYPASYDGVVSVAATDLSDQRAFYSQFNAFVDIAAPGGDTSADVDGDGFPDGVLSTLANRPSSTQIDFNYGFYDGTSMATPHVAGITALMKSVNPGLTPALLDQLLSSGAITVDLGAPGRDDDFGHGRIDALLAVQAAQQLADGTIPITDTPALGVSPGRVSFGATLTERNITLFNAGTGALSITAVTPSSSRITVTPPSDSAGVGAYRLTLNREGATAGQYMESISVTSNGGNSLVNVQYEIPSINQQVAGSVGELYAFLVDWDSGEFTVQQYQSNAGQYEYRFTGVEPGVYFIIAGSDPDNDGFVGGSGEALGTYPTEDAPQLIIANQSFDQLDFRVAYEIPLEANLATQADSTNKGIPAACAPLPPERIRLPCIPRIRR